MEEILEKFVREIAADFKSKDLNPGLLRAKKEQLEVKSRATSTEQEKKFISHIYRQTLNQAIYKNWMQKCINKMEKIRVRLVEDCQRRLNDYYNHEKNGAKWEDELQQIKRKLQDHARHIVNELLRKKEEEAVYIKPELSNHEIENKFQEFWGSVTDGFNSKKEKTFIADNAPLKFANDIGLKYGHVASFRKFFDKFGMYLQNGFKIEWVKLSHVEFIINVTSRIYRKHLGTGI